MFPSSIFSFKSLRLTAEGSRLRWPAGLLCALVILGMCELTARGLLQAGVLQENHSLSKLIRENTASLNRAGPNSIWFVGNSTLDQGVDEELFSRLRGIRSVKVSHGSATLRGSIAMLSYYLRHARNPPREVFVTISKDDLNLNGYRAEQSREYEKINEHDHAPFEDLLVLRATRDHLKSSILGIPKRIYRSFRGETTPRQRSATASAAKVFDGQSIPLNDRWYRDLARDYSIDRGAFQALIDACRTHRLPAPVLILLPATDRYIEFHDALFPNLPYQRIRSELAELCESSSVHFVDLGEVQSRSDYQLYRDPYHMNPTGKDWLSRRIIETLARANLDDNTVATRPDLSATSEGQLAARQVELSRWPTNRTSLSKGASQSVH